MKTILLLATALFLSPVLHAADPADAVDSADGMNFTKPLEKELATIILTSVAEKKATFGTNSTEDFAALIRHAAAEVEKKGSAEADLKTARDNAKKLADALVGEIRQDRTDGETFAGRLTRVELTNALRKLAPLWPFTTGLPLTVPPSVQEIAPPAE